MLLIGQGFLGTAVRQIAKTKYSVTGTYFSNTVPNCIKLDVTNFDQIEQSIKKINPDFIINLASQNNVDFLEKHPNSAFDVNRNGASNIAKIAETEKIKLFHISTDSVFDGIHGNYTETDLPNPINVYAKSKYEGELSVLKNCKNSVIVRTNFYGLNSNNKYFFNWILNQIRTNSPMIGFEDVIFSPLSVENLSFMLLELLEKNFSGIIHLSSSQRLSKYSFIQKVLYSLNFSSNLVYPRKISSMNLTAQRPRNTSLSNKLATSILKTSVIEINEWLQENKSNIMKYNKS